MSYRYCIRSALIAVTLVITACIEDDTDTVITPVTLESISSMGPHPVEEVNWDITDPARGRQWDGIAWLPQNPPAKAPLLIFHHGGAGRGDNARAVGTLLASHGMMVFAPNIIGITGGGGAADILEGLDLLDGANQVGDTRMLIDAIVGENDYFDHRYAGLVDPQRIGLMGFSVGGVTANHDGLSS